ncbi:MULTISPECIES: chorismate mutase [unclassified Pseudomonas]|uniref:chorismate mutase n=1 Tax=unclassified Pseudomonas TaxID=196821 RepID=UPI000BD58284|nr:MULTISPECIES: chorismate mutase [unclassified Pseudomonas]PVZ10297.1 chorismate mutase [Pseudomonas sp. URIL14HWK12:I12]PVZ21723.1 chorismate mutase [Pseudomonas sp. URIL14HWK12:I10]PVZ31194.1 chorismate mutase [Pseudomonas sp. URIL14HWK12:I11]SNZ18013.1 chorismate mutase [Pseudomonas sp. URIL14HWK12:I9]
MRALLLLLALAVASSTQASTPPAALGVLLGHMQQRLALAEPVTLSKWDSNNPVADPVRERQVITAAKQAGTAAQLPADWVARFFTAQIEANKLMQYHLLHQWQRKGAAPATPRQSLATGIRPQLDTLQAGLIAGMAAFAPWRNAPQCPAWVAQHVDTLAGSPSEHLALIRASAELCVTTR